MAAKMKLGLVRVGHMMDTGEDDSVVSVTFDEDGAEVIWPRALGFADAWERNNTGTLPTTSIFRDHSGYLTLREGSTGGLSMSTVGSSQQRIRYRSVVETGGAGVGYDHINGMRSEIEGLARWAKMHPVTGSIEFEEGRKSPRVLITAENLDSLKLGGRLGLTLDTSFHHNPTPTGGVYSVSEALFVSTQSIELFTWEDHAAAHHMIQDLMCLAYGHPCRVQLRAVMRDDDQPYGTGDERRWWPNVYAPDFGRGAPPEYLPEERQPLFYLDEADGDRVAKWLDEFESWSRPTWIAVTTLFQQGSTVEAQLLQVGIALEALGYAIWRAVNPTGKRTPTFEGLLRYVTDFVGIEHHLLFDEGKTAEEWRSEFNAAFKGAKHADNPLPSGLVAITRARQGLTLIRCWLAIELGVAPAMLRERLDRLREGSW